MSVEIEMKIQISDKQCKDLKSWLKDNAQFKGNLHHIEYYLDNPTQSFCFDRDGTKDANDYLRVRFTEKRDTVCLKRWHPDPARPGRHTHCDEYETKVQDGKVTLELLRNLGYTDETIIDKKRDIYDYNEFEIVIDDVKGLGIFVEVEVKKEYENVKDGHDAIKEFLKSIHLTRFREQIRGYVSMLWNPTYDFGEEKILQ